MKTIPLFVKLVLYNRNYKENIYAAKILSALVRYMDFAETSKILKI